MSLKIKNKTDPRMEPWGTPARISTQDNAGPLNYSFFAIGQEIISILIKSPHTLFWCSL